MGELIETSKLAIITVAITLLSGCANDLIIESASRETDLA